MVSITGSTTAAQIRDFERQMRDVAEKKIARAVQYSLNGTAIEASVKMKALLPTIIENPTAWIAKAFVAKKVISRSPRSVRPRPAWRSRTTSRRS